MTFRTRRNWHGFVLIASMACTAGHAAEPYHLNAGDTLAIEVYGTPDLSGQFPVGADGTMSHPLLGSVAVAAKTVEEVRQALMEGLTPYLPDPAVAVHVATYASVYVVGEVEKPGAYEYRPGMTALQLIALAGGQRRAITTGMDSGLLRIVVLQGDYAELALRNYAQEAQVARLEAELAQTDFAFDADFPPDVRPTDAGRAVEAEHRLFELRRDAFRSSDAGLSAQIDGFVQEAASLQESVRLYEEELALLSEDVAATRALVEREVSTPIRLREVLRTQSATRRDSLEVRADLAEAQQRKLDADRRRQELAETFRTTVATELREGELELAANRLRMQTLVSTLTALGNQDQEALQDQGALTLVVLRSSEVDARHFPAEERTALWPGDILRVTVKPPVSVDAPTH